VAERYLKKAARLAVLLTAAASMACGGGAPAPMAARADVAASRSAPAYATDEAAWGKFHSKRFQVKIPLPDGRAWKIDDHKSPELVAVHAPTESRLALLSTQEETLTNRQRCEERARALGWVPEATLTTLEDQIYIGPEAYDSRVWVALDPGGKSGSLQGHVFLFGGFLRKCLLVHLTTSVASAKDEEVLAARLAVGTARIVKAITVDPLRTDDASIPRVKPDIRR
jgi:hypothetical protein